VAAHRFGQHAFIVQILQHHTVKNLLPGGQAGQVQAAREITALHQIRAAHAGGVGETGGGGPIDPHAGRAVAAGPDHGTVGFWVATLYTLRHLRTHAVAGNDGRGHRLSLGKAVQRGNNRCAGERGGGAKKCAAVHGNSPVVDPVGNGRIVEKPNARCMTPACYFY